MESLQPLWETLERQDGATMFQSYLWNHAAARHLVHHEQPHVIALEDDRGAAIIPAALTRRGATFLGEMLFDYRDVLAAGDPRVVSAALAELGKTGGDLWLPAVREDARLAVGAREPWVGAPFIRCSALTPEDFLRRHRRARIQLRRLRLAGAAVGQYRGDARGLLGWLYARKGEQYAGSALDIFSHPARRACMLEIAARSGALCDVHTVEVGSAVAGALVSFRDAGARRLYTIWHSPAWANFSPGIVLLLTVSHAALQEGLDVDFLTGESPHKTRFTNDRIQLYRLQATAAQLSGEVAAAPVAA